VRKALIIASEVRSGSTFVAESIAYHFNGIFGDVLFDLTKEHFADLSEKSSHSQILAKFNSLYLGHQGWVAMKIMCAALSIIVREARKADSLKQALFGPSTHWIVLRRREKVCQAVSLAYARKTGDWHVYNSEQVSEGSPDVTVKETDDGLRSILLSDTYLEAFKSLIASDKIIEVFYEDFLLEPLALIERVYDVLGVARPDGGVEYVDQTKIRRKTTSLKRQSEHDFKAWLLENYHPVEISQALVSGKDSETPHFTTEEKRRNELRLAIVLEFTTKRRSLRFLSEKYGIKRSLISYWVAKHKHGELDERITSAEELAFFKDRAALLQREVDQLKQLRTT
jgi:LPS sulfotransferase NodH/transposase-like protein